MYPQAFRYQRKESMLFQPASMPRQEIKAKTLEKYRNSDWSPNVKMCMLLQPKHNKTLERLVFFRLQNNQFPS